MDALPRPKFLIIGAQKAGTTWLWKMLDLHPQTSLPAIKEIHYFGGAERYRKGIDWYWQQFAGLEPHRLTGEASTTYFYDRMPYWHNPSDELVHDETLPPIPELITETLPEVKVLVALRDPVRRAISAYYHYMRSGKLSPRLGLKQIARHYPKLRILEYGRYARYLRLWQQYVPPERLRVVLFEEDICRRPEQTLADTYRFLEIDPTFIPDCPRRPVHRSWGWTRSVLHYYADPVSRRLIRGRLGQAFDHLDILKRFAVTDADIAFLRDEYLPEKAELEALLGRSLDGWSYGQSGRPATQAAGLA